MRKRASNECLARRIVRAAERADDLALAADGPVSPTWECMDEKALRQFFRDAYVLAKRTLNRQPIEKEKG